MSNGVQLTRRLVLRRLVDVSGVSGTGVVAYGVQFPDGSVVLRWDTKVRSTVFYDSIEDVEAITGHGGSTVIEWTDETSAARGSGVMEGSSMGEGTESFEQGAEQSAAAPTTVNTGGGDAVVNEAPDGGGVDNNNEAATEDAGSDDSAEAEGDSAGNSDNS